MSDTHTATVDAAAFYRAVANAALFAGTDDTLPSLCTVHLTAGEPGELIMHATNRYVLSEETLSLIDREHDPDHSGHDECPPPATDLDVMVGVKGLVKIAKMLKQLEERYPGNPPRVVIEWIEGERHAAFTLTGQASEPDQTLRAEVTDGQFPRISAFFAKHRQPREAEPGMAEIPAGDLPTEWTISQQWLVPLAKVDDGEAAKSRSVDVSVGLPGAPVMFTVGAHFRAMVMPIRKAA
jgi:hypothetical protein